MTIWKGLGRVVQGVCATALVAAALGFPAYTVVASATGWDPLHLTTESVPAEGGTPDPRDAEPWPRAGWR